MAQDHRPLGVAQAGAQLALVRSTLGIVVRALLVVLMAGTLGNVALAKGGLPPGTLHEVAEVILTALISLPVLYASTLRPLTELAAKHAAASAEARFEAIAQAAQDGIVISSWDQKIQFANHAAEKMFGFPIGVLQGRELEELMPAEYVQRHREGMARYRASGEPRVVGKGLVELEAQRQGGERFPIEISLNELSLPDEKSVVAIIRDISARKLADHEIQERTTRLNALLANSPLGMVVLDKNHCVQMCNPAFEELFQYKSAEIYGLELDSLVASEELKEAASDMTKACKQGQVAHAITRRRRKDGSLVDVEVHGVPMLIGGQLEGSYAIYQDISERKKLQLYEQLLPVCCVCGKIRDDQGMAPGQGPWDRLDHYISRHSDAKLTHTFCPECLVQYRKEQGLE